MVDYTEGRRKAEGRILLVVYFSGARDQSICKAEQILLTVQDAGDELSLHLSV